MSLILNIPSDLDTLTQSDDLKTLYIPDLTGIYDSTTNTQGYGASQFPTNQRRTSDIIKSKIEIYQPKDTTKYTLNFTPSSTPNCQDIADGNEKINITSDRLGKNAGLELTDGIYTGNYKVYFEVSVTASMSGGTLVTDDNSNWSTHDVVVGSLLEIGGTIYEVSEISGDTLSFVDNTGLGNNANLTVYNVYKIDFIALLTKSSEKCWVQSAPKALGDFCCNSCRKETIESVKEFITLIDGAKAAYLNESYDYSQEIIDYLIAVCNNNEICVSCN